MATTEIYKQEGFYNPVCDAYIEGAWIAICELGEVPICRDYEAKSEAEARAMFNQRFDD